jgi:hypothetical protein
MLRHTTLLLSGIRNLEEFLVKQALEGALFLFTGAEFLARLAWRSCSIAWTKPLQAFVKVVEGSLISNFASDAKVQFSLENWRKTILKTESSNTFTPRTPERVQGATSCAATAVPASGAHDDAPV